MQAEDFALRRDMVYLETGTGQSGMQQVVEAVLAAVVETLPKPADPMVLLKRGVSSNVFIIMRHTREKTNQ